MRGTALTSQSHNQSVESAHTHVVMFSGGLGSWLTAKRVAQEHGTDHLILLFADVGSDRSEHVGEDQDTYRFIIEAAADALGVWLPSEHPPDHLDWLSSRDLLDGGRWVPGLVRVSDGRDIWQVFKDDRFLGNSRLANCSKFLKQQPCREWLEANCDPATTTVYVGIDWSETHRLPAIERGWAPYPVRAPMTEAPLLDRDAMQRACSEAGIALPRLYRAGFAHNNCGGFCVRSGQAQMELLLREHPERYAFHEAEEQALRDHLGKDVAVLNDRTQDARETARRPDGTLPNRVPLTLTKFRERIEGDASLFDALDVGGCGCFTAEEVPA